MEIITKNCKFLNVSQNKTETEANLSYELCLDNCNNVTEILDSDSDCEEVIIEPEQITYQTNSFSSTANHEVLNNQSNNNSNYDECYEQQDESNSRSHLYQDSDEEFVGVDELKIEEPTIDIRSQRNYITTGYGDTDLGNVSISRKVLENECKYILPHDLEDKDDKDIIVIEDDEDPRVSEDEPGDEEENGVELNWLDLGQDKQEFECELCKKKVASSYNLRRHMMIHTGERPFGCDICLKKFREFSDLKKHRRVHANEATFKCMVCQQNTPSEANATKCLSCELAEQEGRIPLETAVLDSPHPPIETSHKKAFVCPVCDRIFPTRHNLKRHYMIHTGEKPHKCNLCEKRFREVSTMKKHILTHSRTDVFRCSVCCEKFGDINSLLRHKAKHHQNGIRTPALGGVSTKTYLFQCRECGKKFTTGKSYKQHIKVHKAEVLFECYICKNVYRSKERLNSHIVTHSNQDENTCTQNTDESTNVSDHIEIE